MFLAKSQPKNEKKKIYKEGEGRLKVNVTIYEARSDEIENKS